MPNLRVTLPKGESSDYPLTREMPLTIGSQTYNDIVIEHPEVAPLHCRIGWNRTGYEVTAASAQGVKVNQAVVKQAWLKTGDVIHIGNHQITFEDDTESERGKTSGASGRAAREEPELFSGPVMTASQAELDLDEAAAPASPALPRSGSRRGQEAGPLVLQHIKREFSGGQRRPGEQDVLRSPLIWGLSAGAVLALLVALIVWFLMGREQAARLLEQAETELNEGKYAQAIERFEEFLQKYPLHRSSRKAQMGADRARVLREMAGAAPNWPAAWEQLEKMVVTHRNAPDYKELQPLVRDYAEQIALGSARTAEQTFEESLLEISSKATALMERSASPDTPQTGPLEQIRTAVEQARLAIARRTQLVEAVTQMQQALKEGEPVTALSVRARLLRQFPQFAREPQIRQLLEQALSQERAQATAEDLDRPAEASEPVFPPAISPVLHARSRSDETSLGEVVLMLAQDVLYAVDTITGEPRWRRPIGRPQPFFPLQLRGTLSGVLAWDARRRELIWLHTETGQLRWRQHLDQPPVVGLPLIEQGQLYVSIRGGRVLRLDLETGRLTAGVKLSQELGSAPVLSPDKQFVFLVGDRGLLYSLKRQPLELAAMTFTDHAAASVRAPLLTLGRLLLMCENDQTDTCRLRLFDAQQAGSPLTELEDRAVRVSGAVYDAPVLRGAQLLVSSRGERLTVFNVSDEPGREGLALVAEYRLQDGYEGPQYVVLGPDQQFWVSGSAFRRFEITADALRMNANPVAVGLTAQPLQFVGDTFFVARRGFVGEAVVMSNLDRERMSGSWRFAAGARPVELLTSAAGGVTIVTDSGLVYRVPAARLNTPGFETSATLEWEWPPELKNPPWIQRQYDGRVLAVIAASPPRGWLIDAEGRSSVVSGFEQPPQAQPLLLSEGLVWPQPGVLRWRAAPTGTRYEDWRGPSSPDESHIPAWTWLIPLDGREFLAAQSSGHVRRFQLRRAEVNHLAELASTTVTLAPRPSPILIGEHVACITAERKLLWLHGRTLDQIQGWSAGVVRALWPGQGEAFIELEEGKLIRVQEGQTAPETAWSLDLQGRRLAGAPLVHGSHVWLACTSGDVWSILLGSSDIVERRLAPQELGWGVILLGNTLWVVARDGTLYRLDQLPENPA
ncbi:MAG: hypothetical protein KatS3mg113_0122 [Planctomycetaceae bacterium]|nr:MAG: hypothetical protein KatS3mg113_0122 [Planctomycetaceae bacterium]